jgi:2-polyprenyl-3-methyl-5-hydroxy-6-metoxy-1,4-benzoquinol methylase
MDSTLCIACNAKSEFFARRKQYELYKCTVCDTLQLNPMPSQNELSIAYQKEYATAGHYKGNYEEASSTNSVFYEYLLKLIKETERPNGGILDYGCGFGGFCDLLKINNMDYVGIDLSNDMVIIAKSRGLNIYKGQIDDLPDRKQFSAILMLFLFEHLTDYDLFVEKCKKHLVKGGIIIITIPTSPLVVFIGSIIKKFIKNSSLPSFNETLTPPWHTVIFSVLGMHMLMKRHNISIEKVLLSPKSKGEGLLKLIKIQLSFIEKIGFWAFGEKFPLVTSHTFICRRN